MFSAGSQGVFCWVSKGTVMLLLVAEQQVAGTRKESVRRPMAGRRES